MKRTAPSVAGTGESGTVQPVTVSRSSRTASGFTGVALVAVLVLAAVPYLAGGLWGLVSDRFGWPLLPVGYRVRPPRG